MTAQVNDKYSSSDQMLIIEKHERVIAYLYPIIQRTPRQHAVVRDRVLNCLFNQADCIMQAGKSSQVSKLYIADANLSMLRMYLRFYREGLKHITEKQERHAQALIAEVGALLGAWIARRRKGN
jgi:hypothetical protein